MTPAQVTATQIPVNELVNMIVAISSRDYAKFQELENDFAQQHGVEVWEEVFNFRIKPVLDKNSDRWLLQQWLSHGINSVQKIE